MEEVKNDFPYGELDEHTREGDIESACDLILRSSNPHIPYKEPVVITAAIREMHFHSKESMNQFFVKMKITVENDDKIGEKVKEKILKAIILGEKQLNLIQKITPAINRIFQNLGFLVAHNIGSFLDQKDKAKMLLVRNSKKINDPLLALDHIPEENPSLLQEYKEERKSDVRINVVPSPRPRISDVEKLEKTVEMMKLEFR